MLRNRLACLAVAAAGCIAGAASAQNLTVGNPGFESAINYDVAATPGNWLAFFGGPSGSVISTLVSTTDAHTGAQNLATSITGGIISANAFTGVSQPITGIQPGVQYTMKVWAKNLNPFAPAYNAVEYRIEFYDATGALVGGQFDNNHEIHAALTNTYQQFTVTAVAGPLAAKAVLVLDLQSFLNDGTNVNTQVAWDDVTFGADSLATEQSCCFNDGTCTVAVTGQCPAGSVAGLVAGTCVPNPCSVGACCNKTTAACVVVLSDYCNSLGGNFLGNNSSCTPNTCPAASGACCHGLTCTIVAQASCTGTGSAFLGGGSACNPVARNGAINPCCKADFNASGAVSVQDIFDFLAAWFAKCP